MSKMPEDFCPDEDSGDRQQLWRERTGPMPEDFCSQEDPEDRERLWEERHD